MLWLVILIICIECQSFEMPCFISSRGPFGSVYLYLKGSTSPTDVSLPLRPDLGIYSMCGILSSFICAGLVLSMYPFIFSHSWSWYCLFLNCISITLWHAHNWADIVHPKWKFYIMSFQTCTSSSSMKQQENEWMDESLVLNWKWRHLDHSWK